MALLYTENYQNWLMNVEDIASQSSVVLETAVYSITENTQFLGFMFPQVVQTH